MPDENDYKPNTSIYNGVPVNSPEQEAAKRAEQRARRASLPKFQLKADEDFHIDRETIKSLNKDYFNMLDDMRRGFNIASEDLRSFMESVVSASYIGEITKLQRDGAEKAIPLNVIHKIKSQELMPSYYRRWRLGRKKPNLAMRQCLKLAEIESDMEYTANEEEIARQSEFVYGKPNAPQDVTKLLDDILYELFSPWRVERIKRKHEKELLKLLTVYSQNLMRVTAAQCKEQVPEVKSNNEVSDEDIKRYVAEVVIGACKCVIAQRQAEAVTSDELQEPNIEEIKTYDLDELDELEDEIYSGDMVDDSEESLEPKDADEPEELEETPEEEPEQTVLPEAMSVAVQEPSFLPQAMQPSDGAETSDEEQAENEDKGETS